MRKFLRSIRWRRLILGPLAAWMLFAAGLAVAIHSYGYVDNARSADVIIVLGAGMRRDNTPTPTLLRRSQRGAELWHQGIAPYVICTGGIPSVATVTEAQGCADVLIAQGVPETAIFLEDTSRSTEENALNSREIMAAQGWETAVVVSNRYHLLRASWLFNREGMTVYTSPIASSYLDPMRYLSSLAREIAAFHWQILNDVFNLPFTYVPLV